MSARRLARVAITCAAVAGATTALSACGQGIGEPDPSEAHREGLAEELQGVTYNLFITRQINLEDVEDRGYAEGLPGPPPGSAYYGIFLEACNVSHEPQEIAATFRVIDSAGNEFEPIDLDPDNPFAYQPVTLEPGDCIPEEGSLANASPTGGALLMFELPLEAVENLPLELVVNDGFDPAEGEPDELLFELDI
jgi:hypothetical protein